MPKREREESAGGFSGKRNKSWREIDAQKGKSKYHSREDDPAQQKIANSATYTRYKQAADSLFTGGELPKELQQKFDPEGKRSAQKEAMMKLREVADRKAWVDGVVSYLETYPELPDDPFFLDSLLDHPKDRIVGKALGRLETLQEDGKLVPERAPKSLLQRLRSLEMTSLDTDTQARAKDLRSKLFP